MSEYQSDTFQNEVPDREEQLDQDQLQPYHNLEDRGVSDALDEGYSPPEKPLAMNRFGTTAAEEREGETLDERLAQEEPDPAAEIRYDDGEEPQDEQAEEAVDSGEVGGERAGRLVDPDEGARGDAEKDLVGYDVGIDAGAAGAEEAAMHIVPDDSDEAF